jgi:transposase
MIEDENAVEAGVFLIQPQAAGEVAEATEAPSPWGSLTQTRAHDGLRYPATGSSWKRLFVFQRHCLAAHKERPMSEERAKQAKLATQATKRSNRVRLNDLADVHERCAGIDVHKGSVTVCVSTGGGEGELREYPTTSGGLRELRQWLAESAVTHVVMESTGVYWQPVWQILEDKRYRLLLANARHVRNMPGRKTDGEDAAWLATLLRKGLIRGSFVPPAEVRALRDLCRTRATLVTERATVSQRVEKVPEQANVKLDTVVTDVMGVSSRRMIEELLAGQTDRERMAELAIGALRNKIPQLIEALDGHVLPHQRTMLQSLLRQFDFLSREIEGLEKAIEEYARPFAREIALLDEVPGIDLIAASTLIGEIGIDMSCFPTPEEFCRWSTMAPGNNESGGKKKSGSIGQGNTWLRRIMTQIAWAATRTKGSYFSAQFVRLLRRGSQKALVAVAHSILRAIWHMLSRKAPYRELGADYFQRRDYERIIQSHVRKLEALGLKVQILSAA